jgi:hypothetical protein
MTNWPLTSSTRYAKMKQTTSDNALNEHERLSPNAGNAKLVGVDRLFDKVILADVYHSSQRSK